LKLAAIASHVEVGSRGHTLETHRPVVPQHLEQTAVFLRDEQEGKLALHHQGSNVTVPVT